MAKKQIKLLKSLEKDLKKLDLISHDVKSAFEVLIKAFESVPEDERMETQELPKPQEIQLLSNAIAVYSDGGCRGNPGPGACAYVIQNQAGEIQEEGGDYFLQTTNNRMELLGPIMALEWVNQKKISGEQFEHVLVFTDSNYVVQGMKTWVHGWKAKGWKKADGKEPENRDLWERLDQLSSEVRGVEWNWVKGHAGHPQNEYCDKKVNKLLDDHLS